MVKLEVIVQYGVVISLPLTCNKFSKVINTN